MDGLTENLSIGPYNPAAESRMPFTKVSSFVRLILISSATAAAATAAAQDASNDVAILEEITVTAQRRAESLQTSPISITAIDPTVIERRQMLDTKQVVFNVPNLTGNSNVGQSTATTFFMRGVGTTENLATADTSVGLYVDDIYVARQAVNNFNLADVERIEVLRGPQGTLYGRNTNGGAIKIVTKKPSAEEELNVRASVGNYGRSEFRLSGNGSLGGDLYGRVNLLAQNGSGIIYNRTRKTDVNDLEYQGMRVALRYAPGESFEANFAYDFARDETNGGYASDISGIRRARTSSLFDVVTDFDNQGLAKTHGGHLNLSWQLDNGFSVQSITGFRDTTQDLKLDLSDQAPSLYTLLQNQENRQISQELQASGSLSDALRLTAGAYYFSETTDVVMRDIIAPNTFAKDFEVDSKSTAFFGQLEYSIGSVTLLLGARYTKDERDLSLVQTSTIPGALFNFDSAALAARGAAGQDVNPNRSFSEVTPKIGVNWEINDQLFAYASYTEGFRSGGWAGRAVRSDQYVNFNPENAESIEVGVKSTLAGGRARWNTSVFRMDYTDLFNTLILNNIWAVQTADARIEGLESELTVRANNYLDVFASVGILDTKYIGNRPPNLADTLQRAPKYQGKVGASVQYPLQSGTLLLNTDLFFTDDYLVSPANLAFTTPVLPKGVSQVDGFSLLNASVGYRWGEDRYEAAVSCTNCLDKEYFEAGTYTANFAAVYPGAPRLYRLTVSAKL